MNPSKLILFFAAFLMACSGSKTAIDSIPDAGTMTDAGTNPTPMGVDISEVCAELSTVLCKETAECSCPNATSVAECVAQQQPLCESAFALPISGVALGRMRFDGAAASECVAAYANVLDNCADPNDSPYSVACGAMFFDPATIGADCHGLNEGYGCASGSGICNQDAKCVALPTEGQPCLLSRCGGSAVCVAGQCALASSVTHKPIGAACAYRGDCDKGLTCEGGVCVEGIALGGVCDASEQCGKGLGCHMFSEKTCRPKAQEGERCLGDDCAEGFFCDYNQTFPSCRVRVAEGESCAGGLECIAGFACSLGELCVALPSVGETCVAGKCADGAFCGPTNECVALGDEGAACSQIDACKTGLICDLSVGLEGMCVALKAEGGACNGLDEFCQAGLFCDWASNTCHTALSEGAECASARACGLNGECVWGSGPGSSGKCQKLANVVDASCGFECGGGLRCTPKPSQCVAGVCGVL